MLGQRRRRWANIKTTLVQRLVSPGKAQDMNVLNRIIVIYLKQQNSINLFSEHTMQGQPHYW